MGTSLATTHAEGELDNDKRSVKLLGTMLTLGGHWSVAWQNLSGSIVLTWRPSGAESENRLRIRGC